MPPCYAEFFYVNGTSVSLPVSVARNTTTSKPSGLHNEIKHFSRVILRLKFVKSMVKLLSSFIIRKIVIQVASIKEANFQKLWSPNLKMLGCITLHTTISLTRVILKQTYKNAVGISYVNEKLILLLHLSLQI